MIILFIEKNLITLFQVSWFLPDYKNSIENAKVAASEAQRLAVEQIDALFGFVMLGVCGAALTAVFLTLILLYIGSVDLRTGLAWTCYIAACAACHIALRAAYWRSQPVGERWRHWAFWFTVISFAEGCGWGWAPVGLTTGDRFDAVLLVMISTTSVSSGAVSAFGPYLPAFFALFVPAVLPYLVFNVTSPDDARRASCLLLLVFIPAIPGLAIIANRGFKQLVKLRIQTEQLATDLKGQKEIAERASAAKTTFLAAASHDLRQPVHALGLFIGALRRVVMPLEGQRLIEQIEESAVAMDGLFSALLDISQLDAGTVEVQRQSFPMGTLLERICRDHQAEAAAKGLSLVWAPSTAVVDCDPVLLERVLRNLVANAVRYTDHGRVLVGCRRKGTTISIQVLDTGPGIPPDQRDRIFQEYYQLGNPERDRTKGLGLGLAIVRRLVDLLECEMTLRSRVGHGSCFEVSVPMATGAIPASKDVLEATSGALAHGFIVVIDDELAIRNAMSALLAGWGHETIIVGSGDEAILRLSSREQRPDLIICDYRLRDGENGIRVIERLRSEYNETIPAMLITGDTAPDRLAEAKASSLLLLHKPVSNGKLRAAIVHLIAKDRARERKATG
jgi:signal transduction histidine kinase/CheY-like chemotaxis protein